MSSSLTHCLNSFSKFASLAFLTASVIAAEVAELLEELLGNDASVLILDWDGRVDFNKNAPTDNKASLFTGSNKSPVTWELDVIINPNILAVRQNFLK